MLKNWDKNTFDEKVDSLNQAIMKKEFSELEFDGLLLRVARIFDYVLFCFEKNEPSSDMEGLKDLVFTIYRDYERYINYPDLIDMNIILTELKKNVLPLFILIHDAMENSTDTYEIHENEAPENLTDKEKRRFVEMIEMLSNFCEHRLNESYIILGTNIIKGLFAKEESGIKRGKARTWSAGIIYALCKANGILGNNFEHVISPGEIYDYFSVSSSTALLKSKIVIKSLNVVESERRWQGDSISLWDEYDDADALDSENYNVNWTLAKLSVKELEEYVLALKILSEALMSGDPSDIINAAKQCLNISKYVADAYYYLAIYDAKTITSACAYLNEGIEMIESVWDETVMSETMGQFWMDFDTRPYMRLLSAKFEMLEDDGKIEDAIEVGRRMISLSSNDNIGARYQLINLLLSVDDFEGIDKLNESFEQESNLGWNYSIALRYFKDNQLEKANGFLKKAFKANEHIAQYLIGSKAIHHPRPEHYSVGSDEEAIIYVEEARGVWEDSKNAIKWLKAIKLGKPFIHALR